MSIAVLKSRYKSVTERSGGSHMRFNPTDKYVEYSLDLVEAKKLLNDSSIDFSNRQELLGIIKIIERKLDFHYRHKDFNLANAMAMFKRAKKLLNL